MKDLTNGKPIKLIITFALPVCIGNVLQLCYNLADTRIIGIFLGENALASVGATSSLSSLIIGFLLGLTNGFSVITARFFGAKDEGNLKKSVAASLILGIIVSLILTVVSVLYLKPILRLLNTPQSIFDRSYAYIRIIFLGMIFAMLYNICASTLRAIGDSLTPLVILLFSTIVNILLDIFFVKYLKMDVSGAAYATVISQFISVIISYIYIYLKFPILRIQKSDLEFSFSLLKNIMLSGLSMGAMMSLVYFGTLSLQNSINTFGEHTIVAHSAARRITEIYMLPFGVFGTTMTTYCGQNLGAKKYDRIRTGLIKIILITWCWCLLVMLASYTIAPYLVRLVTASNTKEIIDTSTKYLKINSLFYFVPAVITLVRSSMQGIGDHITPIISSSIELVGKVLIVIFLAPKIGYMGIILSEPIVWILMVIPLIIMILRNPVMKKSDHVA